MVRLMGKFLSLAGSLIVVLVCLPGPLSADLGPGANGQPYWGTAAVHYPVLPWPDEDQWANYSHAGVPLIDKRIADPSNGGRAPQNYANVSSSCTALNPDQQTPSIAWMYAGTGAEKTLFFRWRVEQIPNTYATGPTIQPASSVSPYFAAQWTVLIDIDGDGFREFAANIAGMSGTPSAWIDVMQSIYSNTRSQTLDYEGNPLVHLLFHQPTAFMQNGAPDADYILNFHNTLSPDTSWPNGSAERVWDYGSTRVQDVSTDDCKEFIVDYQIPLAMLDATGVGGPQITEETPMCMAFVTANSNENPLQKDVAFDGTKSFTPEDCVPCGDLMTPSGAYVFQPVVDEITASGCGTTTLTAKVRDAINLDCTSTLSGGPAGVAFSYWWDKNANGAADIGESSWTLAGTGTVDPVDPSLFTLSWVTSGLNAGQYLVGVQATDAEGHTTYSHLTYGEAPLPATDPGPFTLDPGPGAFANPAVPGVVSALFLNTCGEKWTLTKSVSPSFQAASGNVTFTLTVANNTAAPGDLTSIADPLPAGFAYRSAPAEGGTLAGSIATRPSDLATGTVAWTFTPGTSIPAGFSRTLTFTARVAATAGTYSNTASAVTTDPDWPALLSKPADVGVGAPRLTLLKSANTYSFNAGETVTYTITYANDSPVNTTGVVLTDTLPPGLSFVSASNGGSYDAASRLVTWNLPDLASLEGPYGVTVSATVEKTASTRTTNTATLDAVETAPATANATIFVNTPMKIQKTANVTLVYPGTASDRVVYTIDYRNTGSGALTGVTITDPAPLGFSYVGHTDAGPFTGVAAEVSGDGYGDDDGTCETSEPCVVTWSAAALAAGASGSLTLTLEADAPYAGPPYAVNLATMASNEAPTVSDDALVGVYNSSGICEATFFHNETTDVGFDGVRYMTDTVSPLATDTGTGILITAPSQPAWIEAVRFYGPPAPADEPLSDTIESRMYIDRSPGSAIWLRGTVYDYDPISGARIQLGQASAKFQGSQRGLHTFTIARSGTLQTGHRLLWVYEAQTDHASKTEQLLFQFDGTVANTVSGTTPATFANSHALLCVNQPSLIAKKTVDRATAVAGDNLLYTITVSNLGTASATGSVVVDGLPAAVTLVTAGASRPSLNGTLLTLGTDYTCAGQVCTFPVRSAGQASGVIAAGASATLVLNATVNNPVPPGTSTLTNFVTATADGTDPASDAVSTAIGLPNAPNVTLMKSADKTRLIPGDTVAFSVVVVNTGIGNAANVVLSDVLPNSASLTYVPDSITYDGAARTDAADADNATYTAGTRTVSVSVGALTPGQTVTVGFRMQVAATLPAGITELANTATATEATTTPANSNTVTVALSANPNLRLTKSSLPAAGPIEPGSTLLYTMTVANIGGATATGVLLTDPVPASTAYLPGTLLFEGASQTDTDDSPGTDASHFDGVARRTVYRVGSLAQGESRTATFSVQVDDPLPSGTTTIVNTATASSPDTASKNATATITATATPSLVISKSAPVVVPYPLTTLAIASPAPAANQITVTGARFLNPNDVIVLGAVGYLVTAVDYALNVVTLDKAAAVLPAGTSVVPTIKYQFSYSNTGHAAATGVIVRDSFVPGLNFLAAYSSAGCVAGAPVNCSVGTVPAGATGLVTLRAYPAAAGSYTNSGLLLATEVPPVASNTVTTAAGGLEVNKTTSTPGIVNDPADGTPELGRYAITLKSQIPNFAATVTELIDVLPIGFTYAAPVSITNGTCDAGTPTAGDIVPRWTNCNVTMNQTMTITFDVAVGQNVSAGTYQNAVTATVEGNIRVLPFDELSTSAEDVTVTIPNDVAVSKVLTAAPAPCAGNPALTCVTYTISARNVGTNPASAVVVNDTDGTYLDGAWPPPDHTFVSASPSQGAFDAGTGAWAVGNLPAPVPPATQTSATLSLTFSVNTLAPTITNYAKITAASDTNPANDRTSASLVPTIVTLSGFEAFAVDGLVVVQWGTASQLGTAGFFLSRLDADGSWRAVTPRLLPALLGAPQGGTYRFGDADASPGEQLTYRLDETEYNGTVRTYGPFTLRAAPRDRAQIAGELPPPGGFVRLAREVTAARATRLAAAKAERAGAAAPLTAAVPARALRITVTEEGVYFVDAARIAALTGTREGVVRALISEGRYALSTRGRPVAYLPAPGGRGLSFYGRGLDTVYTPANAYRLAPGTGLRMESITGAKAPDGGAPTTFVDLLRIEQDVTPLTEVFMKPDEEFWMWGYVFAGDPDLGTFRMPFALPAPAPGGEEALLTLHLRGFSSTGVSPEHHALIRLNGTTIGESQWAGTGPQAVTCAFDQSLLLTGDNTLEVRALLGDGVPFSVFFIDSASLRSRRLAAAAGDSLHVRSASRAPVTVGGFRGRPGLVLDIADPLRPRLNRTAAFFEESSGEWRVSFTPRAGAGHTFVASADAVRTPAIEPIALPTLRRTDLGARYLVIAPRALSTAAAAFAGYRREQGLSARTILLESVYDEFGHGIATPHAIRAFLRYAVATWKVRPRYVLLLGDGSYDYRNHLGFGESLLPVLLARTPGGLFPADNDFGDFNGDHLPELAVGRIPALSNAEALGVLEKTRAAERLVSWRVVMLTDDPDEAGSFPADGREAAALIPPTHEVRSISLAYRSPAAARSSLAWEWGRGAALVSYIGHGGLDTLAEEGLLTGEDAALLTSAGRLPVLSAFTCMAGLFGNPGYDSLAESLLLSPASGALAVWSPTGASYNDLAKTLHAGLLRALFPGRPVRIGDAVRRALAAYKASGDDPFMMDIYNLLGDPALILP